MSNEQDLIAERYRLLFGVRRSVRYHDHRHRHYLQVHSCSSFLIIVLGVAAVVATLGKQPLAFNSLAWIFPAVSAILAAVSLVMSTTRQAALHSDLYRRFIRLEKRFLDAPRQPPDLTQEMLNDLEKERLEIEMDEPAIYRAVDRLCHNELVRSEGRNEYALPLRFYHYLLRDWKHFHNLPAAKPGTSTRASS